MNPARPISAATAALYSAGVRPAQQAPAADVPDFRSRPWAMWGEPSITQSGDAGTSQPLSVSLQCFSGRRAAKGDADIFQPRPGSKNFTLAVFAAMGVELM